MLLETIIAAYPEIDSDVFKNGIIVLQNDSDNKGDYIAEWNYSKPLPDGLKVGK
jgi:hypothetical protein